MAAMGNRAQMRKYRRRRQGAGLILLMSLAILVLGVALFFRTESSGETSGALLVERVSIPMISGAPQAVSEEAGEEQAVVEDSQSNAAKGEDEKQQTSAEKQQASVEKPVAPVPETNDLWMTIPDLGLYDNYVSNSNAESALDYGAAKRVDTEFPWQEDANTYIAAHRLGWPGTASDHQFYNLPLLEYGDKIYLYDANGTTYTYEVTEIFEVWPSETWVTNQVAGRDMVSLQTCIENYGDYWTMGPNWYVRYVVRADRVSVTPA
jgi:sortase A